MLDLCTNCPECVFQDWSKQSFVNYAVKSHLVSIPYLSNIQYNSLGDVVCPWIENVEKNNPVEDTFDNHDVDFEYRDNGNDLEDHLEDPEGSNLREF